MLRTFTPLLPRQAVSQPQAIEHLLETLGDRVELHPVYQRDIKWSPENMGDLINSVMCSGFIPGILLYKLQAEDEREKPSYRTEVVDGQHRFFTLLHFFHSLPVNLVGKKPFLITLPHTQDGHTVQLFYRKTADTEAWEAENRDKRAAYMTEAEKDHFNSFLLDIREIRDPLTLDQRRKIFLSLQKGTPVRGSDLYKNRTDLPLVRYISEEQRWEGPMKALMRDHLSMDPKQYWLHWVIRAFAIFKAADAEAQVAAFMVKDADITKMMKKGCALLEATAEETAPFGKAMERFFAFGEGLPAGVKLTPTLFYATFAHLVSAVAGREEIISSHMRDMSTDGLTAKQRKMWENRGFEDDERRDAFERTLDELERIVAPAPEVGARTTIPKKVRDRVWANAFGVGEEAGACACCREVIVVSQWECAHIVAHRFGGSDEEHNLVPTCRSCNRSMGTENLEDFRRRCYGFRG
jgi:hypothetical protein